MQIVVIGAGVGGLACAARLGALGHQVTVFEQAATVGGKLGTAHADVDGLGRFRFDTGPSILTLPEILADTTAATGADLGDVLALRRLDPVARYRFADGNWFDAAASTDQLLENAEHLRTGNAAELKAFLAHAEELWRVTREPFLERPLVGLATLAGYTRDIRALRTVAPWRTLRSLAKGMLADPRLVQFIDRYATYAGSDPRRAPSALASIPWVEHAYGAFTVDGGLRRIADVLVERATAHHVDVRCGVPVERIVVQHGRVVGVATNSGYVAAQVVVANADAAHLYGDLVPDDVRVAHRARHSAARAEPSLSGLVLCLAVEGRTPGLAAHTVLFPERYDDEFDDLFGTRRTPPRPVRDPTVYVSATTDPSMAPDGHESWFVLVNAPAHQRGRSTVDWAAPGLAEREADRIVAVMEARGLAVGSRVRARIVRSPADLEGETRAAGGSIYGTSSNGAAAAFLRPANRSPVTGLFLVGGSSHPGGGLPLVLLSARIVAGLVGSA